MPCQPWLQGWIRLDMLQAEMLQNEPLCFFSVRVASRHPVLTQTSASRPPFAAIALPILSQFRLFRPCARRQSSFSYSANFDRWLPW
jgi:hypothetical protein